MEVILDCTKLTDKVSAHAYLKEQFSFPGYYGNNLDALYDSLTELRDCQIILQNPAALHEEGSYGGAVLDTLKDAAQANPHLDLSACNSNRT